jgi:hypothetical protein
MTRLRRCQARAAPRGWPVPHPRESDSPHRCGHGFIFAPSSTPLAINAANLAANREHRLTVVRTCPRMRAELLELADHQQADLDAGALAAVKVLREGVAS